MCLHGISRDYAKKLALYWKMLGLHRSIPNVYQYINVKLVNKTIEANGNNGMRANEQDVLL